MGSLRIKSCAQHNQQKGSFQTRNAGRAGANPTAETYFLLQPQKVLQSCGNGTLRSKWWLPSLARDGFDLQDQSRPQSPALALSETDQLRRKGSGDILAGHHFDVEELSGRIDF
jgi:hypothetical protein